MTCPQCGFFDSQIRRFGYKLHCLLTFNSYLVIITVLKKTESSGVNG